MLLQEAATFTSCVPFPWVAIVVGALVTAVGILYRRTTQLSDEAVHRLEQEADDARREARRV